MSCVVWHIYCLPGITLTSYNKAINELCLFIFDFIVSSLARLNYLSEIS